MSTQPTTTSDVDGAVSFWALVVPTTQAAGIYVRVRLNHRAGTVTVRLHDADGEWSRAFLAIEDFTEWLDYIAAGPVEPWDDRKRHPLHRAA